MNKLNLLPKLIIDTDAGHDDVLAMMLVIKSKRFNIMSITTVAGNSTIENATRNTTFTLDLLHKRNISIFSGASKPLKRKLKKAVVHGDSGLDGADTSETIYGLTNNAHVQIIKIVKANPHQVTLLTLGPLTNIAKAFNVAPDLPGLIKEIVITGGTLNGIGTNSRVAEFNMFVDPEAADIVFRANVEKILIPFDAGNMIVLMEKDFDRLKGTELYKPIRKMLKPFILGLKYEEGVEGVLLPDPLAAYYLLNPRAYTLEPMDVVIETKGQHTSGMTVIEKRLHKPRNSNVFVAQSINEAVFIKDFFEILSS